GEWVAAEGAAMVPGMEDAEDLFRRQDCGDGIKASGKRFADDEHIRAHVLMHAGEELACPTQARLNLVAHEQDVVFAAESGRLGEKSGWRNDDAGLALDGFD